MRIYASSLISSLLCALQVTRVLAWGVAGHQIVATIAQIHLLPSVQEQLCDILPYNARCHLAPYAAWADSIKRKPEWRWTSSLHYVNGIGDHPAEHCVFGDQGWTSEKNLLSALVNVTYETKNYGAERQDTAVRFLTHYLGDLHMPMHLSGRDRGGNGDHVKFEGRSTNLHTVWDTLLITQSIRTLSNYTRPLPSTRIESALRGSIFDPYVRWIVWEGIRGWWADEYLAWPTCPADGDLDPSLLIPHNLDENSPDFPVHSLANQAIFNVGPKTPIDPVDLPICPLAWATTLHPLNCQYVWPPHYDTHGKPPELDTPKYLGPIRDQHVVEHVLAMAGVRLAAVLNTLLGGEDEKRALGHGLDALAWE
ncbi:phospholipase C/P1 nuclease [Dacryopinax primogenitus]|uniref:Phospholipase C/P1 nuclease n=1 Tax=Dacryopinax primogenitus (strain DJM 731) TaxID=1858805 RepID=M5GB41_DACPD|nr:phospholipase C/P1 nuclease [Dacryopinax primogenitus]EJU01173.1 phospholipase C/P1 nuclease [Dacryopinax primogenitus]